jgi:putative ABC transport system permease protein
MSDIDAARTAATGGARRSRALDAASILRRSAARRLGEARVLASSSAFSVMALSIFAAAAASPSFRSVLPTVESARRLLSVSSWSIAFFVALSGWFYAEDYLRRRKRELASWILLGMGKGSAIAAISAEFAAAALAALAGGLALGALFSRFFALVLAALMSERSPIPMPFGAESAAAAAIACAAQWAVSTARSILVLRRATLSELLKAERAADRGPAAELPAARRAVPAIAGCSLVAAGYALAALAKGKAAATLILPVTASVAAGTFLAFAAAVPALVRAVRSRLAKSDAAALVAMAQLSFRSRRNSRLAAFAAILVAIAASSLGTVLSLRANDETMARWACPHDLELSASSPASVAAVEAALRRAGTPDPAAQRTDFEWIAADASIDGRSVEVQAFSESAWNAALAAIGEKAADAAQGRLRISRAGGARGRDGGASAISPTPAREGRASPLILVVEERDDMPPVSTATAALACALDDADYAELRSDADPGALRSGSAWDGLEPRALRRAAPELEAAFPSGLVSRPLLLDEQGYIFGLMLFIGSFLAAVFGLAAASIVLFRAIEDSAEDLDRYRSMIGLGAARAVVRRALRMQNAFSFGLPLAVGLCHAAFALTMLRNMLGFEVFGAGAAVALALAAAFACASALARARQEERIYSGAAFGAER